MQLDCVTQRKTAVDLRVVETFPLCLGEEFTELRISDGDSLN